MQTARARAALPRFMLQLGLQFRLLFFHPFLLGKTKKSTQKIPPRHGVIEVPVRHPDNSRQPQFGWIYPPQPDGCEIPRSLNESVFGEFGIRKSPENVSFVIVVVDGSILGGDRNLLRFNFSCMECDRNHKRQTYDWKSMD